MRDTTRVFIKGFLTPFYLCCWWGWCLRPRVGLTVYCRKHADEILRGEDE